MVVVCFVDTCLFYGGCLRCVGRFGLVGLFFALVEVCLA